MADTNRIFESIAKGFSARVDRASVLKAVGRIDPHDIVRTAVRNLPEREAVLLADFKGSIWKAAALLGVTEGLLQP